MPTQQQALEKLCPYMFKASGGKSIHCVGSGCMAWRWNDAAYKPHVIRYAIRGATEEPIPRPGHVPAYYVWFPATPEDDAGWERPPNADADRRGYCGMAGPTGQFDR